MKKLVAVIITVVSLISVRSIGQIAPLNQAVVAINASSIINHNSDDNTSGCGTSVDSKEKVGHVFNAALSLNKPTGTFKLVINSPAHDYAMINVTDMMGRKVISAKTIISNGINNKEFDLTNLSKGLYNVQIITNNSSKSLKMIL